MFLSDTFWRQDTKSAKCLLIFSTIRSTRHPARYTLSLTDYLGKLPCDLCVSVVNSAIIPPVLSDDLFDQPLQFRSLIFPTMMSLNITARLKPGLPSQGRIPLEKGDHTLGEGTWIVRDADAVLFRCRDTFERLRGSYHGNSHRHGLQDFVLYSPSDPKRRDGNRRRVKYGRTSGTLPVTNTLPCRCDLFTAREGLRPTI